jgi:hypothetical protein
LEQVRFNASPSHIGELLARPGTRFGLITTVVVAVAVQEVSVTVTVYTPAMAAVAPPNDGFCNVDVKPLGPDQLYVPPPVAFNWVGVPRQ